MKWYRYLYIGDNAKKAKYKIFGRIRKNRFTFDTFLITIASRPDNILDIYSANIIKQPFFKKALKERELYVVGLAKGRDEALELVRTIVDDTYRHTGGVSVKSYLKFGENACTDGRYLGL